jgi:peptide/nickel transport system substrate-binding protein
METLEETSPDLVKSEWFQPVSMFVALNMNNPALAKKQVRRALMIAMDQEAMVDAVMGVGSIYGHPVDFRTGDAFTPVDQLPAEIKEQFQYDPELAKKMLVEAGYPDGFKVDMICNPQSTGGMHPPAAEMVAAYWGKVGVEVDVKVLEPVAEVALRNSHEGYDTVLQVGLVIDPLSSLRGPFLPGETANVANYDNPEYTELYARAQQTVDGAERTAMFKKLAVMAWEDVPYIPVGSPGRIDYWWPWMKNYHGELLGIFRSIGPIMAPVWIDQTMKRDMGF